MKKTLTDTNRSEYKITDKVKAYNHYNRTYDPTAVMSDDHNIYKFNKATIKVLDMLYLTMTRYEKDLVGLYHNHILKRSDHMYIEILPDTYQEAIRCYGDDNV